MFPKVKIFRCFFQNPALGPQEHLRLCARETYTMIAPNLYFGALFSNQPTSLLSAQPMWLISHLQVFICPAHWTLKASISFSLFKLMVDISHCLCSLFSHLWAHTFLWFLLIFLWGTTLSLLCYLLILFFTFCKSPDDSVWVKNTGWINRICYFILTLHSWFSRLYLYLFPKCVMSTYYVLAVLLGSRDPQTKSP